MTSTEEYQDAVDTLTDFLNHPNNPLKLYWEGGMITNAINTVIKEQKINMKKDRKLYSVKVILYFEGVPITSIYNITNKTALKLHKAFTKYNNHGIINNEFTISFDGYSVTTNKKVVVQVYIPNIMQIIYEQNND